MDNGLGQFHTVHHQLYSCRSCATFAIPNKPDLCSLCDAPCCGLSVSVLRLGNWKYFVCLSTIAARLEDSCTITGCGRYDWYRSIAIQKVWVICCPRSKSRTACDYLFEIADLNFEPGLKAGDTLASILTSPPVCGFRPIRPARLR